MVCQGDEENREQAEEEEGDQAFISHVPVPSQKEVRNTLSGVVMTAPLQNHRGKQNRHVYYYLLFI